MSGLALGLALGGPSWERCLALAERADALGLHSLWLPEHHFSRGAVPSPLVALAAFAARTQRVRLGTTSLLLPLHHPLRVAAEVATLDALSGGRAIVGLGRGFRHQVFDGFGVVASEKRDRFDEALDALLRAWSGEPVALSGPHFGAKDGAALALSLRPVQRPHPPLVVAAFGRKGLLQAARHGLAYLASPLEPLATLAENYRVWRGELTRELRADSPRAPVMRSVFAAANDEEARCVREALAQEAFSAGRGAPRALAEAAAAPLAERILVGTTSELVDAIGRYREQLGMDLLIARCEVPGVSEPVRDAALERLVGEVISRVA